jgi:type IV pilus assembly protein PilC
MPEEKEYFVENLAMLLSSGMGVLLTLDSIKEEVRSKKLKRVIDTIKDDIADGSSLWSALEKTNIFSSQVISLIRLGEKSGRLTENLKSIAIQQNRDRIFRSKVKSAMMYPGLVMSLTVIIGIGVSWFILPKLAAVFSSLKVEMPLVTKILISFGAFLGKYGLVAVPSFILLLAIIIFFLFFFSKTKFIGQEILFRLPVINRLIKEVELSRFGYVAGTLLSAGLPVSEVIDSLHDSTISGSYKNLYKHLKVSIVEEGNSFQKSFASYKGVKKLIPAPIQQMIVAGEQSGNLAEKLFGVGEVYEGKIDITTKNLSVILEPILLIIVWVGVAAVAFAVILPIYSLIGGLNQQTNPTSNPPVQQAPPSSIVLPPENFV